MIKVGDIVRVVGHGEHDGWVSSMEDMVGEKYEVSAIWKKYATEEPYYVVDGFLFCADELEKVESEHKEKLLQMLDDGELGELRNYIEEYL